MPGPSQSDPTTPDPVTRIGRYEVQRLLGEGSMGRVWLAHDPVLDRDVAIKHLRGDLRIPREAREELQKRMRHEARAAARVPHPNLVVLHDMGEDAAVGLFLVFELVSGPTLKQRLADDGRLQPAEGARLARELGAALHVAHAAGVLHRDVKPENVMLAKTGGKITDFGIARIPDSTLTHQGGLMGTPAYSAPETFRGGKHSPASDQFSLAATLYEAISGDRAFPGDDAVSVAARIANDPPEAFARRLGLSVAVDAAFSRALSRRPEDRFPSCEAFGEALAASLAPAPLPLADDAASGIGVPATGLPPAPRHTGQVLVGAMLVVATVALVGRTALRSAESSTLPAPVVSTEPAPAALAAHPRPHIAPRPHPKADPTMGETTIDGGAPSAARAQASASVSPAPPR